MLSGLRCSLKTSRFVAVLPRWWQVAQVQEISSSNHQQQDGANGCHEYELPIQPGGTLVVDLPEYGGDLHIGTSRNHESVTVQVEGCSAVRVAAATAESSAAPAVRVSCSPPTAAAAAAVRVSAAIPERFCSVDVSAAGNVALSKVTEAGCRVGTSGRGCTVSLGSIKGSSVVEVDAPHAAHIKGGLVAAQLVRINGSSTDGDVGVGSSSTSGAEIGSRSGGGGVAVEVQRVIGEDVRVDAGAGGRLSIAAAYARRLTAAAGSIKVGTLDCGEGEGDAAALQVAPGGSVEIGTLEGAASIAPSAGKCGAGGISVQVHCGDRLRLLRITSGGGDVRLTLAPGLFSPLPAAGAPAGGVGVGDAAAAVARMSLRGGALQLRDLAVADPGPGDVQGGLELALVSSGAGPCHAPETRRGGPSAAGSSALALVPVEGADRRGPAAIEVDAGGGTIHVQPQSWLQAMQARVAHTQA